MTKTLSFLLLLTMPLILNSQTGDHTSGISRSLYIPEERNTSIKIGDREVKISILQYGSKKDILYINLHDNETTSFLAAKSVLEEQGGTLINIENNNQRVIRFRLNGINYGFDPNRIYSSAGIGQTLRDNRRYSRDAANAIEKFASQVLALITDSISCIVALHNNFDGGFSVNSYLNGGERQKDARSVYVDSLQDNDDIAFTTDSLLFQKMAEKGFNSIWQDNINAKRDGSLSIYCGENNIRYINIETEHGRSEQYIEMLERLVSILKDEKRTSPTNEEN